MNVGIAAYPRRLIEVDLPIAAISEHARDGRSVHHGHITAIHIWWARKPLPSCRAAALASILPDPEDERCTTEFKEQAARILSSVYGTTHTASGEALRRGLLRFVADISSWRNATEPRFSDAGRALSRAAHESIYGDAGQSFLADPFCGGGSVPLEALRLGAHAYASDLNPVATVISKVTLEYAQRFGDQLLEVVESLAERIGADARGQLADIYPASDTEAPFAYIWFRRIRCEGPRCGADVPLTSKFHLARRGAKSIGLRLDGWDGPTPILEIAEGPLASFPNPTVRRGAATCLKCGYTHPVERLREQLTEQNGGAANALLVAVATDDQKLGRRFRQPDAADFAAVNLGTKLVEQFAYDNDGELNAFPDESLPPIGTLGFRVQRYGMVRWRDLFTPRQLVTIKTFSSLVREAMRNEDADAELGVAVRACLALAVDRLADYQNTGCSWNPSGSALPHLFTRQALPIIWDYGEANPLAASAGSWSNAVSHVIRGLRNAMVGHDVADVGCASASQHPLPTDCAHLVITDPPYYDAIPYADLSDFFYVWLRRMLRDDHPELFSTDLVPRDEECIVNPVVGKDRDYYRRVMTDALAEARRVTRPDGVGVVIFAHKSTEGWEDLLGAMLDAGWIITASWPINTENAQRLRAQNSAVLGSSVHLVCRPRENPDGSVVEDTVGDWRDILADLPGRIHAWLPRLSNEGIVGADAIFSCLGPALELFSRYARVEKVSGERVDLKEYLEQVWAAVSREALAMIFEGADTASLEADARLTAMWLWTLSTGQTTQNDDGTDEGDTSDSDTSKKGKGGPAFELEFDAARKIAQGLGIRFDHLPELVKVKGDRAWLVPVESRAKRLLAEDQAISGGQLPMAGSDTSAVTPGVTTLDRIHQSMLLFSAGDGEKLRRFLVEDGVGSNPGFWGLAQSLSALYPAGSIEKRWVDGVLGRKRSLGFG
jgi:adenine-specific DNA methylase